MMETANSNFDFLVEIPETLINTFSDFPNFERTRNTAEAFRAAEMTPFYLYDPERKLLFCKAKETFKKLLN